MAVCSAISSVIDTASRYEIPSICNVLANLCGSSQKEQPKCCNALGDMKSPQLKCTAGLHVLSEVDASRRMTKSVLRAGFQKALFEKGAFLANFIKEPRALAAISPPEFESGFIAETNSNWASTIGYRKKMGKTMDDAHLGRAFDFTAGGVVYKATLTGIFDGFGGPVVSRTIESKITPLLMRNLELFNQSTLSDKNIYNALRQTMADIETYAQSNSDLAEAFKEVGSTLNIGVQIGQQLYTANLGDSRSILVSIKNGTISIRQLTEDQKVSADLKAIGQSALNRDNENELVTGYFERRVKKGGGVYRGNRVFTPWSKQKIMVTRAIGALNHKGALESLAKVGKVPLDPDATHIFMQGCDGLFDVANSEDYAQLHIELQNNPDFLDSGMTTSEAFVKNVYALKSKDNLTSMVTLIKVSHDDVKIETDQIGVKQAQDYMDDLVKVKV